MLSVKHATLSARNNCHLYSGVCKAHGIEVESDEHLLCVRGQPPRFFSKAVTKSPLARPDPSLSSQGIKDSFSVLNLPDCEVLFDASWIWCQSPVAAPTIWDWRHVSSRADLLEWLEGWATGDKDASNFPPQFPEVMLDFGDFAFFAGYVDGSLAGGCVLNEEDDVVGVSNTFCLVPAPHFYSDVQALSAIWRPSCPITGYLRGEELEEACASGFDVVGPLRVWSGHRATR